MMRHLSYLKGELDTAKQVFHYFFQVCQSGSGFGDIFVVCFFLSQICKLNSMKNKTDCCILTAAELAGTFSILFHSLYSEQLVCFHSDFRVLWNNSGLGHVKSCKAGFCCNYDVLKEKLYKSLLTLQIIVRTREQFQHIRHSYPFYHKLSILPAKKNHVKSLGIQQSSEM